MSDHTPPITRIYDLADLSEAGYEASIVANAKELEHAGEWVGVEKLDRFEGRIELTRLSQNRFLYEADLDADVVQSCVVTLKPVKTHIARSFSRELHLLPGAHRFADKGGVVTFAAAEDEAPEEIESSRYDLAGPLLEELVLGIDPYPRADGVVFEPPAADSDKPESPFAILKSLKTQG